MKRVSGVLLGVVLTLLNIGSYASGTTAGSTKIGVVDLQRIMQTSSQMKAIQQKLEGTFKARRDKLVTMEEHLKKEMQDFKRDSTVMNVNKKRELEKKIIAEQQTFEREGQQYQQELSTAHNEAMEDLYGKIRKAITHVAEEEKYEIVLQKDAAPFSIPALDITDKVMQAIS